MASPSSSNPNVTSQKASATASNISYPLNDNMTKRTVLRFEEYNRDTPSSEPSNKTTAIINLPLPQQIPDVMSIKSGSHDMAGVENISAAGRAALDIYSGASMSDTLKSGYSPEDKKILLEHSH